MDRNACKLTIPYYTYLNHPGLCLMTLLKKGTEYVH